VGNGRYSPNNDIRNIACSNAPSNANYTSDGNGSNNCSWACQTDRYLNGGNCSAVGTGYYSPNNNNTRTACSNRPSNSSYTSDGNGGNNCAWSCNSGYVQSGNSCVPIINGSCGSGHNSCTAGSLNNTSDNSTRNLWECVGSNTGSTASCSFGCPTDQHDTDRNGTCANVGNGRYSPNNDIRNLACSNAPSNANYTSDGNGSNNCSWACRTDYYLSGGNCVAVGTGYYSPNNNNSRTACSNRPSNSSYTSDGNGGNSCAWSCNSGYTQSGNSCVPIISGVCGSGFNSCSAGGLSNISDTSTQNRWQCTGSNGGSTATCTQGCPTDQHDTDRNGSCANVGNGRYSPNNDIRNIACNNAPSNANYTSDGNGGNNCNWGCQTDRYLSGGNCVAVGNGYYSPNSNNTRYSCSGRPSNANWTSDGNGGNNCSWACQTDRYLSGGNCVAVGNGYYSPNSNNTRYSCSGRPSNANWTSDGNGGNNCSWACQTDRYLSGGNCVAVGNGYYSPNSNNTRYSCTNKPSNSSYTSDGNGGNNCSWSCNSGYTRSGNSCVASTGTWRLESTEDAGGPLPFPNCSSSSPQGRTCSPLGSICDVYDGRFYTRVYRCQ